MKLTLDEVRGIFIKCQNTDKDGLYHGEGHDALDLLEFANHVATYIGQHEYKRGAKNEHKRIVKLVKDVNKPVAELIQSKREYARD